MNFSKRDRNILLVVAGVLVVLAVYFFIFLNLQDKTEALKQENQILDDVIVKLKDLDKNREQYLADTEQFKAENQEIKEEFPAGMKEEDDLLYINGLEGSLGEYYASAIGMPSAVNYEAAYPVPETINVDEMLAGTVTNTATDATAEGTEEAEATEETDGAATTEGAVLSDASAYTDVKLYYVPVSTAFDVNYVSFKQLVTAMAGDADKKSIEEVAITYNEETGLLSGTMTSNFYYMQGTDEVYETPDVSGVSVGTSNPFRSVR